MAGLSHNRSDGRETQEEIENVKELRAGIDFVDAIKLCQEKR